MKLGIMQGRLSPREDDRFQCFPRGHWREEFPLAAAAGLDTIEWIYDAYGEAVNPLATDGGIAEIERLAGRYNVRIESICADWFMDFPLLRADAPALQSRWGHLRWLMQRGARLKVNRVVIPFVDASAIHDDCESAAVAAGIGALTAEIERTGVELHLETALPPDEFAALLSAADHPGVKVNYDSGNSASLGFKPVDEFAAYGSRVGSVHLKDRYVGAGTVPLGDGDTDFDSLFDCLRAARYGGDFILQVARGADGDELDWSRRNVRTARQWMHRLEKT